MGGTGSGRIRTKVYQNWLDQACDLTFREAALLMKDESIPRLDRVRVCLPLALKRIPDKQEVVQLTLNANPELLERALSIAQRNLTVYERLNNRAITHAESMTIPQHSTSTDTALDSVVSADTVLQTGVLTSSSLKVPIRVEQSEHVHVIAPETAQ